jgi:hypothetical protein
MSWLLVPVQWLCSPKSEIYKAVISESVFGDHRFFRVGCIQPKFVTGRALMRRLVLLCAACGCPGPKHYSLDPPPYFIRPDIGQTIVALPDAGCPEVAVPFGNGHISLNTGTDYNHPSSKNLHNGWDYLVDSGTEVIAPASGRVVINTWQLIGGGGRMVVVDAGTDAQGNRIYYLIAHLSQSYVSPGQSVLRGDALGQTGRSGGQRVPHLHFSTFTTQREKLKSRFFAPFFLGAYDVLDPAIFALAGGGFPPFDSLYNNAERYDVFHGFSHPLCAIP